MRCQEQAPLPHNNHGRRGENGNPSSFATPHVCQTISPSTTDLPKYCHSESPLPISSQRSLHHACRSQTLMADQAARRRMLAKGQKPSRLRHEVRPDSAGDKRESHNPVVQEPYSDVVIPDSQSDPSRHAKESLECHHPTSDLLDVPLSPNSLVTLNRFGASKKISVLESDSAIFKTFTKNPLEFESASVFAPHVFSHKPPTVQRSSVSSANQESSRQESHGRANTIFLCIRLMYE